MSRKEEESFLLSINEASEELKNESEIRKTSVSVVTVLLSLIVTVATVSLVTMSGSGQPAVFTEKRLAVNPASLWTLPSFGDFLNVSH